jgi:hypothetical protein
MKISIKNEIDEELMKRIKKNERELMKNTIPLHYMKVDERISSTVYKIPIDYKIKISQKNNKLNINDQNIIYQKHYKLKTINNDNNKRIPIRKNFLFPKKPFSLTEMGYKYYNQQLSPFIKNEKSSTNFNFFRKSKSPFAHYSNMSTLMNTANNFYNNGIYNNNNNIEIIESRSNFSTPSHSLKAFRSTHSPFYRGLLNNSIEIKNKNKRNKLNNSSRIRHRLINVCRYNEVMNNNKCNNNIINKSIGIDSEARTINLNKKRNIFLDLDDNYNNLDNSYNLYSLTNHHIERSPRIRLPRAMRYNENHNQKIFNAEYNRFNKKQFEDNQCSIGAKQKREKEGKEEEIQVLENEDNNEKKSIKMSAEKRDLGDNYKYYERKDIKIPINDEKINHIRRSPVHVYGFHNFVMKDNKKMYLNSPPIKGKLIRMYRNNTNNNCKVCQINENKNIKLKSI